MTVGIKHTVTEIVTSNNTADKVGSGLLPVYATPSMIALMEKCASECVAPYLEEGKASVGTMLNVKHVAASPIGIKITCNATLTEIDGRRLVFALEAFDETGLIGEGTHERFVIDTERFMAKCQSKLEK
ncbi:MAG: thioesterase family protein [Clostridia bacterium]|nr:thioesterase family protein [Clostridia bacterium]